jgi:hypothetical protein
MKGTRRDAISGGLAAAVGFAAAEAVPAKADAGADDASLRAAFDRLSKTLNGGDVEGFLALRHDRAVVIDEDSPFVLDKALFREHVDFHLSGMWTALEWLPREPKFEVIGTTGVVSTYFTLRGKPKDAGFRLRHGLCTVCCNWDGAQWRAGMFNIDPLSGHVVDASPT